MKKYSIVVLAALVSLLSACGGKEKVQKVYTEKATVRTIVETVSASGKVQPVNEVKISPDVSGEITDLLVKEGEEVKKGQVLLKINPDLYNSALARVEANADNQRANLANAKARLESSKINLRNAELQYNRNKKLFETKAISAQEFDNSQAQYDNALADVKAAENTVDAAAFGVKSADATVKESRDNLNRTTIFAPTNGTVSKLNSRKGERVVGTSQMAGTEILRIADLTQMEVQVDVNENDIVRVHLGDTADIGIDAYTNRKFKGIVTDMGNSSNSSLGSSADQVTNFQVKIRILPESYADLQAGLKPNESPFRPGMTADVEIKSKVVPNALAIPTTAITTTANLADVEEKNDKPKDEDAVSVSDDKEKKAEQAVNDKPKTIVFLFNGGKAKYVEVTTGVQDNQYIEVLSGLKNGDEVIAGPYRVVNKKLNNDVAVEKKDKDYFRKATDDE